MIGRETAFFVVHFTNSCSIMDSICQRKSIRRLIGYHFLANDIYPFWARSDPEDLHMIVCLHARRPPQRRVVVKFHQWRTLQWRGPCFVRAVCPVLLLLLFATRTMGSALKIFFVYVYACKGYVVLGLVKGGRLRGSSVGLRAHTDKRGTQLWA